MMYVTGVSYVGSNNKKRTNQRTKRYPMVYYYNESGDFCRKRIKWYEVPFFKMQIIKKKRVYCTNCEEKFTILVRKNEPSTCPQCLS
jgi:hypothetical protein